VDLQYFQILIASVHILLNESIILVDEGQCVTPAANVESGIQSGLRQLGVAGVYFFAQTPKSRTADQGI
jgi:hypothetical protein